jgi:DNA-binding NarL/FixJ family response regulator
MSRREIAWPTEARRRQRHDRDPRRLVGSATEEQSGSSGRRSTTVSAPTRRCTLTAEAGGRATSPRLTRREAEVLGLLALRWTDKAIAAALGIGPRTPMGHVAAVRAKLGVRNRREAGAAAPRVLA